MTHSLRDRDDRVWDTSHRPSCVMICWLGWCFWCKLMLMTVVHSGALTTSASPFNPLATALKGRSLYEIERWLRTVTQDSMNISVAL